MNKTPALFTPEQEARIAEIVRDELATQMDAIVATVMDRLIRQTALRRADLPVSVGSDQREQILSAGNHGT
jgi:hypothetical protein